MGRRFPAFVHRARRGFQVTGAVSRGTPGSNPRSRPQESRLCSPRKNTPVALEVGSLLVSLLPTLLLACKDRTPERGTSARSAANAGAAAAPGEGVQWLIGQRFAVGIVSSHGTNVIRLWQLHPEIRLLDTLVVPALTSSETLVGFYCRLHHTPDPAIVAVAAHTDAAVYRTIHRAWKADTVTGKLIPTSVGGVDCQH